MKTTFLSALAKDGAIDEPNISVESLGKCYGPLQKQVRESIAQQEKLVAEIQVYIWYLYNGPVNEMGTYIKICDCLRVAIQNLQTSKLVAVVREKRCFVNWLPLTMHLKS